MNSFTMCPGCKAQTGSYHAEGCEIEQCSACGGERSACFCETDEHPRIAFDGEFPGAQAARNLGWFTRYTDAGWERCTAADEGAVEDVHRVLFDACWVPDRREWTRQRGAGQPCLAPAAM